MKQPGIRKSRIEQLKYEIQQLDNKIYESNDKVLGNSLKKHQSAEFSGRNVVNNLKRPVSYCEQLKSQLLEVCNKLQVISKEKAAEKDKWNSQKDRLNTQIAQQQLKLQQMTDQYNEYNNKVTTSQDKKKQHRQQTSQEFQNGLKNLERKQGQLQQMQKELQDEIREQKVSAKQNEVNQQMRKEDLQSRIVHKGELLMHEQAIGMQLDYFQNKYPALVQNLQAQIINNKNKEKISNQKQKIVDTIKRNEAQLFKLASKLENGSEEMLDKLETQLRTLCYQNDLDYLEDVVLDLNTTNRIEIDELILRQQVELIKQEKGKLIANQNLQDGSETIRFREAIQSRKKGGDRCRLAAIDQWLQEVALVLGQQEGQEELATDSEILDEFFARIEFKISQQNFSNVSEITKNYYKACQVYYQSQNLVKKREKLEQDRVQYRKKLMKLIGKEKQNESIHFINDEVSQQVVIVLQAKQTAVRQLQKIEQGIKQFELENKRMENNIQQNIKRGKLELNQTEETLQQLTIKIENMLEQQRLHMINDLQHIEQSDSQYPEKLNQIQKNVSKQTQLLQITKTDLAEAEKQARKVLASFEQQESELRSQKYHLQNAIQQQENQIIEPKQTRSKSQPKKQNSPQIDFIDPISNESSLEFNRESLKFTTSICKSGKYRLLGDNPTNQDKQFYAKIIPLLEGADIYKKFNQKSSQKVFDPLGKFPPEQCGYCIRNLKLTQTLDKIEVKRPFKPQIEQYISVDTILGLVIPPLTREILKIQRRGLHCGIRDIADEDRYEDLKERGILNIRSDIFQQRALECSFYVFSLALSMGGRVELVAKDHSTFVQWVNGINQLVKNRKKLGFFQSNIEFLQIVKCIKKMGCWISQEPKFTLQVPQQSKNPILRQLSIRSKFVNYEQTDVNNNYEFLELIGEGGFAKVFKAVNKLTGQYRAIKRIKKSGIKNFYQVLQEIEILRCLDHPNIVKIFEVYEGSYYIFIVSELCQGGNLLEKLLQEGPLSEHKASTYIRQILMALKYCHNSNIVHKDIKPENILFKDNSLVSEVKLIDFGIAEHLIDFTPQKEIQGSIFYLSPEVIEGEYGTQCDIWSLGIVLYTILAGYPPFNAPTNSRILDQIQSGFFTFNENQWACISFQAKDLIRKMLKKDPYQRITVEQALRHPWICNKNDFGIKEEHQTVLNNILNFTPKNEISKRILNWIASHNGNFDELELIVSLFNAIDSNQDGKISKQDLQEAYSVQNLGHDQMIDRIMEKCDSDNNGYLDFTEFLTASINWQSNNDQLQATFKAWDQDQKGFISIFELEKRLGTLEDDDLNDPYWTEVDIQKFLSIV